MSAPGRGCVKRPQEHSESMSDVASSTVTRKAIWALIGAVGSVTQRVSSKYWLVERKKGFCRSSLHHSDHFADTQDAHHAFQVVGKDMKTHLGAHAGECLRQEVSPTHPVLDRSEWVLNRA